MKQITLIAAALFLFACGGSDKPTETPVGNTAETTQPVVASTSPVQSCEAMFAKARECTDDYIPALVDLRISLDMPPGIAAAAQTEGRGEIIAQAKTEWETDSQPEAASASCQTMVSQVPEDKATAMAAQLDDCMNAAGCAEYSQCIIAAHKEMFAEHAAHSEQ